jgi:hypothetical protein
MWALLMMWQCINEVRSKMSFLRMTLPIHSYLDNLCLACNLENSNWWNYSLRVRCFIIVSNIFWWCVTLGNRVHKHLHWDWLYKRCAPYKYEWREYKHIHALLPLWAHLKDRVTPLMSCYRRTHHLPLKNSVSHFEINLEKYEHMC